MNRLLIFLLAGCSTPLGGVFPPPVFPTSPGPDDWPDVGAAVLDDVATIEYRIVDGEDGEPARLIAVIDHRRRIKILNEGGLAQAKIELPINGFSTVTWVKARAVNPDGSSRALDPRSVRAVPRGPPVEANPEVKNLVFEVPGARVGGLVEYRYERVFLDPDFVPVWVFGGALPVVRAELGIVTAAGVKVDYRFGHGEEAKSELPLRRRTADGRERLIFVVKDLPAYYYEPDMPHLSRVAPWLALVVTRAKLGTRTRRLETWNHVVERVRELFDRVGGRPGTGTPERRYRVVRNALTPLGAPGLGVRQPVPADGLSRGESACARDAAAYLLAAMQDSGVSSYAALMTGPSGPVVFEDFPALYPFVGATVAVDVSEIVARDPSCRTDPIRRGLLCTVPPDSYAFLDPLCKLCRYGELPTELTGGRALVLLDDGPRWVDVPIDPPERNRVMTQFQLSLQVTGSVKGGVSGELTGAPQRRVRRALASAEGDEARDGALTRGLFGDRASIELFDVDLQNVKRPDRSLRFRGRVSSQVEKLGYERFQVRVLDIAGPALPGRYRSSRRYAALLEAPAWVETTAALDLPVGFRVMLLPPTAKIVEPCAEYAAGFAWRDRTLRFTRRLVVKQHVLAAEEWPAFRRFLDRVGAYESQGIEVEIGRDGR